MRRKDHVGSIYKRKGSDRLYLSLPPRVAEQFAIPRDIATGIHDTPDGRAQARGMLIEITRRYYGALGIIPVPKRMVSIREAFDKYMSDVVSQRSHATRRGYVLSFNAIMSHGDSNADVSTVHRIGDRTVSDLERALMQFVSTGRTATGPVGPRTIELYATVFQTFAAWAHEEGLVSVPIRRNAVKRRLPAKTGKPIAVWDDEEIDAMLRVARAEGASVAFRRCADIIDLLRRTPLRIHEALELRLSDVDTTTRTLRVKRKDGKTWEYVPLREPDLEAIVEIAHRNAIRGNDVPILGYRVTSTSRLLRTFVSLLEAAGVERRGRGWHEFKKTYITRMVVRVGRDLSLHEAARLARCSSGVLERHYLKLTTDQLRSRLEGMWT